MRRHPSIVDAIYHTRPPITTDARARARCASVYVRSCFLLLAAVYHPSVRAGRVSSRYIYSLYLSDKGCIMQATTETPAATRLPRRTRRPAQNAAARSKRALQRVPSDAPTAESAAAQTTGLRSAPRRPSDAPPHSSPSPRHAVLCPSCPIRFTSSHRRMAGPHVSWSINTRMTTTTGAR